MGHVRVIGKPNVQTGSMTKTMLGQRDEARLEEGTALLDHLIQEVSHLLLQLRFARRGPHLRADAAHHSSFGGAPAVDGQVVTLRAGHALASIRPELAALILLAPYQLEVSWQDAQASTTKMIQFLAFRHRTVFQLPGDEVRLPRLAISPVRGVAVGI